MQSDQMKDCLAVKGYKDESCAERNKISFKSKEIPIWKLPLSQKTYQAPRLNEKQTNVGTSGQNHNVGELENNLFKVKSALKKTQFAGEIDPDQLTKGSPQAVLKIMHHFLFRASERFSKHIHEAASRSGGNVHEDLKYLPDLQFYKNVALILCDLFGYRVDLTAKQFFQDGYGERKLILLLDLYDIMKNVRKSIKVNDKFIMQQDPSSSSLATDLTVKRYQIVNHQEQVQKSMLFKINMELQKRQLTVVEEFQIQNPYKVDPISEDRSKISSIDQDRYVPLRQKNQMIVAAANSRNQIALGQGIQPQTTGGMRYTQTFSTSQAYPMDGGNNHQMSQMMNSSVKSDVSGDSKSVFSITRQRDRKEQRKVQKEQQERQKTFSQDSFQQPRGSVQPGTKGSTITIKEEIQEIPEQEMEASGLTQDQQREYGQERSDIEESGEQEESVSGGTQMTELQALQLLSQNIVEMGQKYEQMEVNITDRLNQLEDQQNTLRQRVENLSEHEEQEAEEEEQQQDSPESALEEEPELDEA